MNLDVRKLVIAEFRAAAEDASEAASDTDGDLAAGVHTYRKALRRARAIVKLVRGEMRNHDRKDILRALRDARRAVGNARDAAVFKNVFGSLEHAGALLEAAASSLKDGETRQLLGEGAARAQAQVELLETVLPPHIAWDSLVDGVRQTYREARRARRAAKHSRSAFHRWRRRSKELAIQLDVLAAVGAPSVEQLRESIVAATDQFGDIVDLLMARDFVRVHGDAIDRERADALAADLTRDLDTRISEARDVARDVFRKKPRKFARTLHKAVQTEPTVTELPRANAEEFAEA